MLAASLQKKQCRSSKEEMVEDDEEGEAVCLDIRGEVKREGEQWQQEMVGREGEKCVVCSCRTGQVACRLKTCTNK